MMDYAWAQCLYLNEHHRKAAFQRVSDAVRAASHDRPELNGASITSGLVDGRPNVAVGVPSEHADVLASLPWGPDALNVPVPEDMAAYLLMRHLRVRVERGAGGWVVANHDAEALAGTSYLRPDGTLGEKP